MPSTNDKRAVTRDGLYPIHDGAAKYKRDVRAQWTGEIRCPQTGEWYLSGAIVEAYRAHNELRTPYHIARLVETTTKRVILREASC